MPYSDSYNNLAKIAAEKMGVSPEEISQMLKSQNADRLLSHLSAKDALRVKQVLSDKAAAEKLLSSPEAQKLLRKFRS